MQGPIFKAEALPVDDFIAVLIHSFRVLRSSAPVASIFSKKDTCPMLEGPAIIIGYIDPGSGSLLLQFVIAGCVGAFIAMRQRLGVLVLWIRHKVAAWRN